MTIYFGKKEPYSPQRMRGTRTVPDRMIDRFEKLGIGERLWGNLRLVHQDFRLRYDIGSRDRE